MAVPADVVVNYATNPAGASATGYAAVAGTGGTAALSSVATGGPVISVTSQSVPTFQRTTWSVATTAVSGGCSYTQNGLSPSTSMTHAVWVRSSVAQTVALTVQYQTSGSVNDGAAVTGTAVALTANTWTLISVAASTGPSTAQAVLTAAATTGGANWANGNTFDMTAVLMSVPAKTQYEDGNSPSDASYRYKWQGTANASLTMGEYRGVWVELAAGSGAPAVQVYVSGTGTTSSKVTITRTADNETWTVPGWNNRVVIDADTLLDSVVPLDRNVIYTAYLNGTQLNQMSINVASSTGWVQDPWDPTTAMPVDTVFSTTTRLCLAMDAMETRVHGSDVAHGMLMGSKRQYALTNTRQMDDSVNVSMYAHQNDVSDSFRALLSNTPILLFRGLRSWGSIPGLAYTDGPAKETMINRQRVQGNGGTTRWDVTGPLIQPVTRTPLVSTATYSQMATALANTTYATIAARSGSKRYIDVKANPLGL